MSLLAACSPYSYSKEISKMSDGVNALSTAYNASFDAINADWVAQTRAIANSQRAQGKSPALLLSPTCLKDKRSEDDPPCAIYVAGEAEPKWTEAERQRKPALDAMKALRDYATALAAVTNASDRSAYDAAVGQLAGAVGTVTSVANGVAPGASAVVSAGINIFGWLVGTALDEQRYDSLKKAVMAVGNPILAKDSPGRNAGTCYDPAAAGAKPPARSSVRILTDALCDGLEALAERQKELLSKQVRANLDALNFGRLSASGYATAFADAQTALAAQEALRKTKAGSVANDLADAHDKLLKAINDPNNSYAAFMKAVGDFADKVSAVEAAIKANSTAKK